MSETVSKKEVNDAYKLDLKNDPIQKTDENPFLSKNEINRTLYKQSASKTLKRNEYAQA